ncbi:MAG: long-chain fatty acid--CoA ligase [Acidobacteria bacterium]|nr:long-chain fatty acid--CoA ligase [Acidobacteriota bacterium]
MCIFYTSGTTGAPKGVVYTRRWTRGLAIRSASPRLNWQRLRCMLLPFPPYHFAGFLGIIVALVAGSKLILMERFDPLRMLAYIQDEKVTQIAGSPTMYRLLLNAPGQERYDLSSVRCITFSGETCPYDLAQALHERFRCQLENIYGTTECSLISWTDINDSWEKAATTVGKPVPGVRVRIVDEERHPRPVGERGEIAVKSPQVMLGYHNAPELTAQVLDEDGWFYTGDIGYFGEDGYLRLVDRKKDVIIRGGENIYPVEVEHFLQSHPAIRRAAVLGVPAAGDIEEIWAYVEVRPGYGPDRGRRGHFLSRRHRPLQDSRTRPLPLPPAHHGYW